MHAAVPKAVSWSFTPSHLSPHFHFPLPLHAGTQSLLNDPRSALLLTTSPRRNSPSCTSMQTTEDSHQQPICWGPLWRKAACCTRIFKRRTSGGQPLRTNHPAPAMKCLPAHGGNDGLYMYIYMVCISPAAGLHLMTTHMNILYCVNINCMRLFVKTNFVY